LTFTPGIDLLVTRAHVDGYAETNDRDFGAALADRNRTSARLGIGAAVRYAKAYGWGSAALHAKGRYVTELGDKRDTIAFAYTAQPDIVFDLQGPKTGVDYGAIEIGADVTSRSGLHAGLSYAPRLDGHGFIDHAAVFNIGFAF